MFWALLILISSVVINISAADNCFDELPNHCYWWHLAGYCDDPAWSSFLTRDCKKTCRYCTPILKESSEQTIGHHRSRLTTLPTTTSTTTATTTEPITCPGFTNAESVTSLVTDVNNLGATLLYESFKDAGEFKNVLISPASLSMSTLLLYAGARGNTANELQRFLFPSVLTTDVEGSMIELIKRLSGDKRENYKLDLLNALVVNEIENSTITIDSTFIKRAKHCFNSSIETNNFADDSSANAFLKELEEKGLDNNVRNILVQGSIDQESAMALISSVSFEGHWAHRFVEESDPGIFRKINGDTQAVPMISANDADFYFGKNLELDASILGIPFSGKEMMFYVILPNRESDGLSRLQRRFSYYVLDKATGETTNTRFAKVSVPELETVQELSVKTLLNNAGIRDIFGSNKADFSGMGLEPGDIKLTDGLHKATFKVTQSGVTGDSRSALEVLQAQPKAEENDKDGKKSKSKEESSLKFIADRPFLFAVKHRPSNVLVLLGQYSSPKEVTPS